MSGWEGAVRNVALVYSPLIKNPRRVSNDFIHITDFLATFMHLSGFEIPEKIDGINQWETMSEGVPTKRKEIFLSTDSIFKFNSCILGKFKILKDTFSGGEFDRWLGEIESHNISKEEYNQEILSSLVAQSLSKYEDPLSTEEIKNLRKDATVVCQNILRSCDLNKSPCLFNILEDPCEQNNLAELYPEKLEELMGNLQSHLSNSIPDVYKDGDPNCDPNNFNYTWSWWQPDT